MHSGRLNGKLIMERVKARGITFNALAAEIGVSPSLIRQMSEGYLPRRHATELLEKLSKTLGVSVGALTSQDETVSA